MFINRLSLACAITLSVLVAACGGGGGSSPAPVAVAPTATPVPTAAPQQIVMSLPGSVIGSQTDATFGVVSGYTQQTYSQVLGFVPGAQIMIVNGQAGVPHTLDVVSQTGFTANPAPPLATTAAGGSTLAAGFASGAINGLASVGPITLTAGLYYIGCGFHYVSNGMRTVLDVATAATPGPQATTPPSQTPPPNQFGY